MSSFVVRQPGLLSSIQDLGRFGAHNLGLTTGGPLDPVASHWANRLLENEANASIIEISFGGLTLESNVDSSFVITGADMPCKLNNQQIETWRSYKTKPGDTIEIGFATQGLRCYLAVKGGFNIPAQFGSSSTVVREKIGGLNGDKLQINDVLNCAPNSASRLLRLNKPYRPDYSAEVSLRLVKGYQQAAFDYQQQWKFFNSAYTVTERSDRMGFRLEGSVIESNMVGMLSEGICHGAVQIPADGQPIVLMNDRQTIGGYPKIGSVIPLDTGKLSQLKPGTQVQFEETSIEQAHNIHCLHQASLKRIQPEPC